MLVFREHKAQQALRVLLVLKVQLEHRALLVLQVFRVLKVQPVLRAHKVL